MQRLGGVRTLKWAPLVTPERKFFPPTEARGEARAEVIFRIVCGLMGVESHRCELVDPALGTPIQTQGQPHAVTYSDVSSPGKLVAEFATQLAELVLAPIWGHLPGGDDLFGPACSATVVYKGLGIFGADMALQTWAEPGRRGSYHADTTGYLSEQTMAFLLALYLALTDRRKDADAWLDIPVKALVHDAARYLDGRPDILEPLRRID